MPKTENGKRTDIKIWTDRAQLTLEGETVRAEVGMTGGNMLSILLRFYSSICDFEIFGFISQQVRWPVVTDHMRSN